MKKNLLTGAIFISLIGLVIFVLTHPVWKANLISPMGFAVRSTPVPTLTQTPVPSVTPKTFKFDSSTDLKAELEKVNPKVEDSDFK